jgi:putative aldouronate transport system substrate-binding protein
MRYGKYFFGGEQMKRRIFSLVLVLALVATAVSATGNREQSTASGSGTDPITFTIFVDHSWLPVDSFTGIIPEEITRITGVTLNPTIAINGEQLGIMAGSGQLPDLVYTQNMVTQMSDPDLVYSYEELISRYNTGWQIPVKQLGIGRGLSEDGKAYTILNHYSEKKDWVGSQSVPMLASLIYRLDLYQAIGSPPMRNLDELFDVFTKIKAANPNLQAILKLNDLWNLSVFTSNIGMGGAEYIEQSNGQYIYYTRDQRFKEVLAFVNKCWRAGFISPDESYFVRGSTVPAAGEWFAACSCTQNALPGTLADLQKINPNFTAAEMVPFPNSSFITSDTGWSGTFITKNNKNPERAIRFIQWMFTPEAQALTQMGRRGIDYNPNPSGLPIFSAQWAAAIANGTHDQVYNPWFYLGGSETVEADARVATTDPKYVADAYKVLREKFDNYPWIMAARPIGTSAEKVIMDKITELTNTYNPRIIMASTTAEFETLYNEYLTNANRTGLPQLETYVNNKIKQVMPLYK